MNNDIPGRNSDHAFEKLFLFSKLADEALNEPQQKLATGPGYLWNKKPPLFNIDDMLNWKTRQDQKHELFMYKNHMMCNRDAELCSWRVKSKSKIFNYTDRTIPMDTSKLSAKTSGNKAIVKSADQRVGKNKSEKKPECWHFLRGHCKRGEFCDFNHDIKRSYPDECKVFLGGLPFQVTEVIIRKQLLQQGFNVVNKPKIYGGFSPQVCLASAAEAEKMIKEGHVMIEGMNVEVRPWKAFTKKTYRKLVDAGRRSVFLGGLREGTTSKMIKRKLKKLGFKVMNYPSIKPGFCPQVTLLTAQQALKLVNMAKVQINGALVDVRPYVGIHETVL